MTVRKWYFLGFLCSGVLLLLAYYFQYLRHLNPCPLCMQQRGAYYLLAILLLIASCLHSTTRRREVLGFLITLAALWGIWAAAWQVHLQHLPPMSVMGGCAPGLDYVWQHFPLLTFIQTFFSASGDCALVPWRFLGWSMAEWSLLFFLFFFVAAIVSWITARQ